MLSSRPYLLRALYEWISDSAMTPHLLVNAQYPGVEVPSEYVQDGRIVLNVSHSAVQHLLMDNEWVSFSARFGGVSRAIRIPMSAVMAIYARENGQGMAFGSQPGDSDGDAPVSPPSSPEEQSKGEAKKSRPTLKVVK